MKRLIVCMFLAMFAVASAWSALAQIPSPTASTTFIAGQYVVRDSGGLPGLNLTCLLLQCTVQEGLGDPAGQLFVITQNNTLDPVLFMNLLLSQQGVLDAEPDQVLHVMAYTFNEKKTGPPALYDDTAITYYGGTVIHGYVYQPATSLIRLADAQANFNRSGAGIVAVIDTGVDANQPVLKPVLVPGYDFVNNSSSVDETGDVDQSSMAVLDSSDAEPGYVNQSTMAVLDQSTMAVLDGAQYAAFGHGTMVSGVIHLIAPTARIMPLKAFKADGTGSLSDVIRAVYFAEIHGAKVLNMSFDFTSSSFELKSALDTASTLGMISVASAGNDGEEVLVYPAAYSNVMGVASTSNCDELSSFSNYGPGVVWVGAPGEGVITTYPYSTWAAVWGTSFSAPMVSGTAALLVDVSNGTAVQSTAASAIAHADYINPQLNHGRLNINTVLEAWSLYIAPW